MAIKEDTMFLVKNRSTSNVIYAIPSLGIRREFAPGETMRIAYGELEKFMWEPGAKKLLVNFLQIQAEEVLKEFNMPVQPEYHLTEDQIKDLMLTGSLDAFLDCLDFAPNGVIELIKSYAVSLPLSDYEKRNALKEKTGFDVDAALANKRKEEEEAAEPGRFTPTTTEKSRPSAAPATGRRTSGAYASTKK